MLDVRRLRPEDEDAWKPLWAGYLAFYHRVLDPAVSEVAFRRLANQEDGMFGLLAVDGEAAVGLAHVVIHPATWSSRNYAYLEDLFVAPAARGSGAAHKLIEAVYASADALEVDRVYWHTQEYNGAARSFYDQVAHRTSFIVYQRDRQQA